MYSTCFLSSFAFSMSESDEESISSSGHSYSHTSESEENEDLLFDEGNPKFTKKRFLKNFGKQFKNAQYEELSNKSEELLEKFKSELNSAHSKADRKNCRKKYEKIALKAYAGFEPRNVRAGYNGAHEIFPTNMVKVLFLRSCGLEVGVEPNSEFDGEIYNWLHFQNVIRVNTESVVFETGAGHSSEVKFIGSTCGQKDFHDRLRDIINNNKSPIDATHALLTYHLKHTLSHRNNPGQYAREKDNAHSVNAAVSRNRNDIKRTMHKLNPLQPLPSGGYKTKNGDIISDMATNTSEGGALETSSPGNSPRQPSSSKNTPNIGDAKTEKRNGNKKPKKDNKKNKKKNLETKGNKEEKKGTKRSTKDSKSGRN